MCDDCIVCRAPVGRFRSISASVSALAKLRGHLSGRGTRTLYVAYKHKHYCTGSLRNSHLQRILQYSSYVYDCCLALGSIQLLPGQLVNVLAILSMISSVKTQNLIIYSGVCLFKSTKPWFGVKGVTTIVLKNILTTSPFTMHLLFTPFTRSRGRRVLSTSSYFLL